MWNCGYLSNSNVYYVVQQLSLMGVLPFLLFGIFSSDLQLNFDFQLFHFCSFFSGIALEIEKNSLQFKIFSYFFQLSILSCCFMCQYLIFIRYILALNWNQFWYTGSQVLAIFDGEQLQNMWLKFWNVLLMLCGKSKYLKPQSLFFG